jgi:hypothetical protein
MPDSTTTYKNNNEIGDETTWFIPFDPMVESCKLFTTENNIFQLFAALHYIKDPNGISHVMRDRHTISI